MKKFIGFALVCALFVVFGCDTATTPDADNTQTPGGGEAPIEYKRTVFYEDSITDAYREVSAVLGTNVTWEKAKELAEKYDGGGYTDWYLPTPAELNQLYKSGQVAKEGTLWSSEEWGYWNSSSSTPVKPTVFGEAWVYNFADGTRSHHAKSDGNSVRAVRSYNTQTYALGNEGPGGGIIFEIGANGYKEVSAVLGTGVAWDVAISTAEAYSYNGCNDWYLPNATELNEVYTAKKDGTITIDETNLCSSSEYDNDKVWAQSFDNGYQGNFKKTSPDGVRAIRSFNTSAP